MDCSSSSSEAAAVAMGACLRAMGDCATRSCNMVTGFGMVGGGRSTNTSNQVGMKPLEAAQRDYTRAEGKEDTRRLIRQALHRQRTHCLRLRGSPRAVGAKRSALKERVRREDSVHVEGLAPGPVCTR